MNRLAKSILLLSCFSLHSSNLFAEIIILKDGTKLKGKITKIDDKDIHIQNGIMGDFKIQRHRVREFGSDDSFYTDTELDEDTPKKNSPRIKIEIDNNNANEVSQSNRQELKNKNNQKSKKRRDIFDSALYSKLAFGSSSIDIVFDESQTKSDYSGIGSSFDLLSWRMNHTWELALTLISGSASKNSIDYNWSLVGFNLKYNFLQKRHEQGARSKFYFSTLAGGSTFTVESGENEIKMSGTGYSVELGYDFLLDNNVILTAGTNYGFGNYSIKKVNQQKEIPQSGIQFSSSSYFVGVGYNLDL